jgi:hypothetical protein
MLSLKNMNASYGMSKIEENFRMALERLEKGKPTNPQLLHLMRAGGLRINITSVAKEAGHSRRLVYHYKELIETIHLRRAPQGKNSKAIISDLRSELAERTSQRDRALALVASLMVLIERLKEDSREGNSTVVEFPKR